MSGDSVEEVRFSSPWCRGFDVRFTYQRMPEAPLRDDEIIRRYAAHWNRGDALAVAALFSEQAVLIEPFTRTQDGNPQRHEGRERVQAWLAEAFATTPWLALELDAWLPPDASGQTTVSWRYMDARLAKPVRGRNLFVLSGGEIFASELQLLDEPVPLAEAGSAPPAGLRAALSSAPASVALPVAKGRVSE
jgi:hypothetical protein